jgi:hypothetical protein
MNMNILRLSVITALALLAGCAQKGAQSTGGAAAPKPVATVNGQALTSAHRNCSARRSLASPLPSSMPLSAPSPGYTKRAEAVAQQAEKEGLDKVTRRRPCTGPIADSRTGRDGQLSRTTRPRCELKAEYDTQVAAMPKTQYKARHILVKTRKRLTRLLRT